MVIKRANSFLVRSTGTLPLTNQKRTILSDSGLNRKDQLSYEEQELKNKEPFAPKDVRLENTRLRKCSQVECSLGNMTERIKDCFILHVISGSIFPWSWILVGPTLPGIL